MLADIFDTVASDAFVDHLVPWSRSSLWADDVTYEHKFWIVVETQRNRPPNRSESVCAGLWAPHRSFWA